MSAIPESRLGTHVRVATVGEAVHAFVPPPLPPKPPVRLHELYALLDRANQALGRLDGISSALPDARLFLYTYVRKEALLSSQIEGTQSSLSEPRATGRRGCVSSSRASARPRNKPLKRPKN